MYNPDRAFAICASVYCAHFVFVFVFIFVFVFVFVFVFYKVHSIEPRRGRHILPCCKQWCFSRNKVCHVRLGSNEDVMQYRGGVCDMNAIADVV